MPSYLARRGDSYFFVIGVPTELRGQFKSGTGKPRRHIVRALKTKDRETARVAALKMASEQIAEFNVARTGKALLPHPVTTPLGLARHFTRRAQETPRLSELIPRYFSRSPNLRPVTVTGYSRKLEAFRKFTKDAEIGAITRGQVSDYIERISKGRTAKTTNSYLTPVYRLFVFAQKTVDSSLENPVANQFLPEGEATDAKRPFTTSELKKLVASISEEGRFSRPQRAADVFAWFVPIALFSAMRPDEISQLCAEDIKRDGSQSYFDLRGKIELKTKAARRVIPVHPMLETLGFLDYVKVIGKGTLWPCLTPSAKDGKRSHHISRDFKTYRISAGLKAKDVSLYSARKCAFEAMRNAAVPHDFREAIMGHQLPELSRIYGPNGIDLKPLAKAITAIDYPEIDWSRLSII